MPDRARATMRDLRVAAVDCQACDLYKDATQTVFSTGSPAARVMMVGEQPGDVEDRVGEPFVGPAGRLLNRAMAEVGIARDDVYLTNAVKHFKFQRATRGKRRIHQKPAAAELTACRPWLRAELVTVQPDIVVVLGASAAATMLGRTFRVSQERGRLLDWADFADGSPLSQLRDDGSDGVIGDGDGATITGFAIVATVHPSAVLRARERDSAFTAFVADLKVAGQALERALL